MLSREPSYLDLHRKGVLQQRAQEALHELGSCRMCPRGCGVNRLKGEEGFCRTGRKAKVASYNAHFGEESPLVGRNGSGTIFFSSCNLLCGFCQNYDISHRAEGVEVDAKQLAAMMTALAERGCHNINFVTPSHVVPQILEALVPAVEQGLSVPLVYNCGGYDRKKTIKTLRGIFDIYMPDFKFWDNQWAESYCAAEDYRQRATEALKEMHRQVGDLMVDDYGIALRGLLLRHLVMPSGVAGTAEIMSFVAAEISTNTYINVMDQYRPCGHVTQDEFIDRRLTAAEYRAAVDAAKQAGLTRLDPQERMRLVFRY